MEKYFWFLPSVFFTTCFLLLACEDSTDQHNSIIWELNNLEEIGGHAPEVLGSRNWSPMKQERRFGLMV
jgi:hypothetical protein